MKQTEQEVAKAFSDKCLTANAIGGLEHPYDKGDMINAFHAGAEWQAQQSPWINARETPNPGTPLLVRFVGRYRIRYTTAVFTDNDEFLDDNGKNVYNVTHYMPIPKLIE